MTIIYIKKKKRINRGYIGDFPNSCYLTVIRHGRNTRGTAQVPPYNKILLVENVSGGSYAVAKLNKGFLWVNVRRPIGGRVFSSFGSSTLRAVDKDFKSRLPHNTQTRRAAAAVRQLWYGGFGWDYVTVREL